MIRIISKTLLTTNFTFSIMTSNINANIFHLNKQVGNFNFPCDNTIPDLVKKLAVFRDSINEKLSELVNGEGGGNTVQENYDEDENDDEDENNEEPPVSNRRKAKRRRK